MCHLQVIGRKEICGSLVPELDLKSLEIVLPTNGAISLPLIAPFLEPGVYTENSSSEDRNRLERISEDLSALLELELKWGKFQRNQILIQTLDTSIPAPDDCNNDLSEQWAELLCTLDPTFLVSELKEVSCFSIIHPFRDRTNCPSSNSKKIDEDELIQIPIGESVVLRALFHNRLTTKVVITNLSLEISPLDNFTSNCTSASIPPGKSLNVLVEASPTELGIYQVRYLLLCFPFVSSVLNYQNKRNRIYDHYRIANFCLFFISSTAT